MMARSDALGRMSADGLADWSLSIPLIRYRSYRTNWTFLLPSRG